MCNDTNIKRCKLKKHYSTSQLVHKGNDADSLLTLKVAYTERLP